MFIALHCFLLFSWPPFSDSFVIWLQYLLKNFSFLGKYMVNEWYVSESLYVQV